MSLNEFDKDRLNRLYNKYVLGQENNNNGGNGEMKDTSKEIVEGLGNVKKAVEGLKPRELTKAERQLDNFLGTEFDKKLQQAKERFLELPTNQKAEFQKANPELYEKMFPSERVEIPMPSNYKQYKELLFQNENDVTKLPYNVKLYAMHHDKEFYSYIQTAEISLVSKHNNRPKNSILEGIKKMQEQEGQG